MECNTSQEPSDTAGLVGSPNKFQQEVQPTQALNNSPSNFNPNGARIWKKPSSLWAGLTNPHWAVAIVEKSADL